MPPGRIDPQDVESLQECLRKPPAVEEDRITKLYTAPERLICCVLSLNRRWDRFVVPSLLRFRTPHSDVATLMALYQTVAIHGGAVEFYKTELDYDYPDAANMFHNVLIYLLQDIYNYPGSTESDKLHAWKVSSTDP
jgi:hypothetical protein